uniref:Uncharacterized protein n=1 Tax=Myripristis murdjan TaxID=586833 RepID=A0A667ZGV4_9TELE
MELPFTTFELTFIIIAFSIFSLYSLASVCIQTDSDQLLFLIFVAFCVTSLHKRCILKENSRYKSCLLYLMSQTLMANL